jgi:serine/threonine-protein kinase
LKDQSQQGKETRQGQAAVMVPTQMDRKTFLANLRRSGLVSAGDIRAVKHALPKTERGRVIARALVEQGLLTKFQAELLLAGRTQGFILGQYRILDQLGQGGMGRVFKAMHQTMNRVVALKVLAPQLVKTEKAQRLFQREVRAAARLIHANIVTAYDANQVGDRHYLVMEYVDGPNLDQLVRDQGPLPVGLACELIRQVANGLQHAFEMGMVHRDIKPANILVQAGQGERRSGPCMAKILDFGLARLQERDQEGGPGPIVVRENVVLGTPDFLSPEQARNLNQVDIRSDLYSLGCTLYFLLTAQVPFPGGTTLEKLIRHSTEEPKPVEQVRTDLPPVLAEIVRRLMAKNIVERFQTPAEAAAALAPLAVQSAAVWDGSAATRPPDALATLTPSDIFSEVDAAPAPASSHSGSALAGTVGPEAYATPISAGGMSSLRLGGGAAPRRGTAVKLLLAAGVLTIAGLLGAAGWLLFQ